jgi:hypothetical protein
LFNWGLHDGPAIVGLHSNITIPGQEGNTSVYKAQLANITARLVGFAASCTTTKPKLLFATTTPMLCTKEQDDTVLLLNAMALDVMKDPAHRVPVLDLHAAIVGECGAVPQQSCPSVSDDGDPCFCPHCNDEAYAWLSTTAIAPAIRKELGL